MASTVARAEVAGATAEDTWSRYRDNLARHLIGISRDFQSRLRESLTHEYGFGGLRLSFAPLVAMIWSGGRPLGDVAATLGISTQAASQLANLIEEAGYLVRIPNPRDRRGVVLAFTPRGVALIEDAVAALDELDRAFFEILGEKRLADLHRIARDLYLALHLEAEVFETSAEASAASRDADAEKARRSGREIAALAERLQQWLGREDAARLVVALKPRTRRSTT